MTPRRTEHQLLAEELKARAKSMDVPISKLKVDMEYQRNLSRNTMDEIVPNYNPITAGQILVSDRGNRPNGKIDGGLFIVNGQHRARSAEEAGYDTISALVIDLRKEPNPVKVEAAFRLQANVGLSDSSLEKYKAELAAGDPRAHAIRKMLARYDTEINLVANAEFGVNCVGTIKAIYDYDGGSLLQDTLDVMKDAYGEIRGNHASSSLFKGIAWFIEAHSVGVDRKRLIDRLQTMSIAQLNARAKTHASIMGKSLWFNIYRTIVELYNDKLTAKRLEVVSRGAARLGGATGQKDVYGR